MYKIKANVRFDNVLEYIWLNSNYSCPLYLEESNFNLCDLSDEEISAVLVEDLSFGDEGSKCSKPQDEAPVSFLLNQYEDIFKGIGNTDLIEHGIELKSNAVVNLKPYPIPHAYRDQVKEMIRDMLDQGIIEDSVSEWSSPIVCVKKKDGSIRLAIDYRKLNALTKQDAFPTPSINEIINGLNGAKIFSTLDFKSGYYQIPMRSEDKPKTAFKFDNKLYQFKRMPFGLCTAMQTFLRLMSQVFQFPFVKAYVDDVIIFSNSIEEHLKHLELVFDVIRKAKLSLNPKKCEFLKDKVEYLGFIIGNNTIRSSKVKTDAILKYPVPKDKKSLKSFLGLINSYRHLIPKFADKTWHLYNLLKKNVRFKWTSELEKQFSDLKSIMAHEPVVQMPDLNRTFIVRSDASDKAMAALLIQENDQGQRVVIEYFSKKFSECQSRYATVEKEATAVKFAIDRWQVYLKGRHFVLETDHKPLVWLKTMASRNNKLARMAIELSEYDFEVKHVKGVENCDADALSRIEIAAIQFDELESEQRNDLKLKGHRLKNTVSFTERNGLLYFQETASSNLRLCIPQSRVVEVLNMCHNQMNHIGQQKVIDVVYHRFYWPGWRNDVKQFIRKCDCNIIKDMEVKPKAPLLVTDIDKFKVFERVAIDTMSIHKSKKGNKVITHNV